MFGAPFSVKHSFEVIYFFKNITKKFIFFREEAKIKIWRFKDIVPNRGGGVQPNPN